MGLYVLLTYLYVESSSCVAQILQVIDACTDIAYNVTAPAAGGVVSSRSVLYHLYAHSLSVQ